MSNDANDTIKEMIVYTVAKEWGLENRPDLMDDCIEEVTDELLSVDGSITELMIMREMIRFYESKCYDAVSTQDLEHMSQNA